MSRLGVSTADQSLTPAVVAARPTLRSAMRRAIADFDERLSRQQKVTPFSDQAGCILRYSPSFASQSFKLSDGATVSAGDRIIDIHCWNERVPQMPPEGPSLAWAQATSRGLRTSLELLASALVSAPALRDVRACRARVNFVGQGKSNLSVSRIIHRYGFEDVAEERPSPTARLHDALENILIAGLVWVHNPAALRRDKLLRERRPVWASRENLLRLYAA